MSFAGRCEAFGDSHDGNPNNSKYHLFIFNRHEIEIPCLEVANYDNQKFYNKGQDKYYLSPEATTHLECARDKWQQLEWLGPKPLYSKLKYKNFGDIDDIKYRYMILNNNRFITQNF